MPKEGSSDYKTVSKRWFFKEPLTECFFVQPKMVILWHRLNFYLYLSIHPSIHSSINLFIHPSIYSIHPSVHPSPIHPSSTLLIHSSTISIHSITHLQYLFIHPSIHSYIHRVYQSNSPPIHPSTVYIHPFNDLQYPFINSIYSSTHPCIHSICSSTHPSTHVYFQLWLNKVENDIEQVKNLKSYSEVIWDDCTFDSSRLLSFSLSRD